MYSPPTSLPSLGRTSGPSRETGSECKTPINVHGLMADAKPLRDANRHGHHVTVEIAVTTQDVLKAARTAPEAGVHLACASLELLGLVAQPTSRNTKGVDVLVLNPQTGRTASLQVKTKTQSRSTSRGLFWPVGGGGLKPLADFFVFVHIPRDDPTVSFYVDPSTRVKRNVRAARGRVNRGRRSRGKKGRADENYGWHFDMFEGSANSWALVVEQLRSKQRR